MPIWRRKFTQNDEHVTSAVHLTLAQSLIPNFLGPAAGCPLLMHTHALFSYDLVLLVGICLRSSRCLELPLSDGIGHHSQQIVWISW